MKHNYKESLFEGDFNVKKIIRSVLKKGVLFIITLLFVFTAKAQFAGGSGTEDDPYQITTITQLDSIRNHLDKNYILMNDLNFAGSEYQSGEGWDPIGNEDNRFTGNFSGNGYRISNLYISSSTNYVGLFGYIEDAEIDDLGIIGCDVLGEGYVGGLSGYNDSSTVITNSYVSGSVAGNSNNVGVLSGYNRLSDITECYSGGSVSGNENVGCLLGYNDGSTVSNCYATGKVTGTDHNIGGLVGCNYNKSKISYCYSSGIVEEGDTATTGGFYGVNGTESTIAECYYNSETSEQSNGGGDNVGTASVTALSTLQMKQGSNFIDWELGIWGTVGNNSYPALISVSNNAPFAFSDSLITTTLTEDIDAFSDNDYDYETTQDKLVYKIISTTNNGSISSNIWSFNDNVDGGSIATITYCVGELIADGDTLWGNIAISTIKYSASEIFISSNDNEITDGDTTPSIDNSTNFGYVAPWHSSVKTFTIYNKGSKELTLSGVPIVSVSGSDNFTVTTQPASSIAVGESTTFSVIFSPSGLDINSYSAEISIANNDNDENPYTFIIKGTIQPVSNKALDFEGTDDYVSISNFDMNGSSALTIETWVNLRTFNSDSIDANISNLICGGDENALLRIGDADIENNQPQFVVTTGSNQTKVTANTQLEANTWYHLAGVYDGSSLDIYINGLLDSSVSCSGDIDETSNATLLGGATSERLLDGELDEIRIWSTARTATEIRENMMRSLYGNETGLIAYYMCNEDSGTLLTDATAYGNDGTLNNMTDDDWVDSETFTTWLGTTSSDWNTAANWTNGVPVTSSNVGIYKWEDNADASISGSPEVNNLLISSTASPTLGSNITVNNYLFLEKDMDLNGNTVTIGSSGVLIEDQGVFSGTTGAITTTQSLSNITSENVGGLGAVITTSADMGSTTITRSHAEAEGNIEVGILRQYNIVPSNNSELNATLTFNYLDKELNGISEQLLYLFKSENDGTSWTNKYGVVDSSANSISLDSIDGFALYTAAIYDRLYGVGNSIEIANGDVIPSENDNTDFGTVSSGSSLTNKFTLINANTTILTLTGSPLVAISGSGDFTVKTQPNSTTIDAGDSITFEITYTPSVLGTTSIADVIIANNSESENPYTFRIQGTVSLFEGSGTEDDPYQITNITQLDSIRNHLDKNYILMNDLDFAGSEYQSGEGWDPIGNEDNRFTGNFSGNGYRISNLYINRSSTNYVGLFGYIEDAEIDDLGIIGCDVLGEGYVGCLSGYNDSSKVTNSYANGSVAGSSNDIGVLSGYNRFSEITKCYSGGSVSGNENVGCLLGYNEKSTVSNCYATGKVTGTVSNIGGLVGCNYSSTINNCYSSGIVSGEVTTGGFYGVNVEGSSIKNCYYNSETSEQSNGGGENYGTASVTALSTLQMNQGSNFSDWELGIWGVAVGGDTYPALISVSNNAPFAYDDTVVGRKISIDSFIVNDYDYEMLQKSLVAKVTDAGSCTISGSTIILPDNSYIGDTFGITYCVGEFIAEGDTLWGNTAKSQLVFNNTSPVFVNTAFSVDEDIVLNDLLAIDSEGDDLSYIFIDSAVNGSASVKNDLLLYSPSANFNGNDSMQVVVSDKELSDTAWVYIAVTPVNDAPELVAVSDTTIEEDTDIALTKAMVTVADVDNEYSELLLVVVNGDNYSINGTTIMPDDDFNGKLSVPVAVTDGDLNSDTLTMIITVTPVNDAPTITSTAGTSATENVEYTYSVVAEDPEDSTLSYFLSNEPDGMKISDNVITWTPTEGTLTSGEVTLTVSDGEYTANETFIVAVTPVDDAPIITSTAGTSATENVEYTYYVVAEDSEDSPLTYSLSNEPSGMVINDNVITWTPTEGILTSGEVTLTVSDGEYTANETFIVVVTPVNDAPIITSTAGTSATENVEYTYSVVAEDPEDSTLSYFLSNAPSGMVINGNVITWTPASGITSSGEVTLIVSDGELLVTETFIIAVSTWVGIEEIEYGDALVYPNPVTNKFVLSLEETPTDEISYNLFDVNGRCIAQGDVTNKETEIQMGTFKNGNYILVVLNDRIKLQTFKIIKK